MQSNRYEMQCLMHSHRNSSQSRLAPVSLDLVGPSVVSVNTKRTTKRI